ncbi:MAG: hypothetical protein MZV63_62990 [Marinilabiliales bacterium]|nr:hypothetical protein [Marinilabiliales bacterium]
MIHGAESAAVLVDERVLEACRPAEGGGRVPVPRAVLPRQPGRGRPEGGRLRPLRRGPGRLQRLRHPGARNRATSRPTRTISGTSGIRALLELAHGRGRRRRRHEDAQGRRPPPGPREIPDRRGVALPGLR